MSSLDSDDMGSHSPASGGPITLGVWQRWLSACASTVLVLSGTYAVIIVGRDGFGAVALILSGLLLGLLAILGRMPSRIWGKGVGVDFMTTEQAEQLLDDIPRDQRQGVAKALLASASIGAGDLAPSVRLSNAAAEADIFEGLCRQFLESEVLPVLQVELVQKVSLESEPNDGRFADAIIDLGFGRILIEYRLRLTRNAVRRSSEFLQTMYGTSANRGAMIILVKHLDMDPLLESVLRPGPDGRLLRVAELPSLDSRDAMDRVVEGFVEAAKALKEPTVGGTMGLVDKR